MGGSVRSDVLEQGGTEHVIEPDFEDLVPGTDHPFAISTDVETIVVPAPGET